MQRPQQRGAMTLNQAERVVAKFGGLEQMVEDTDHPYKRIWNWLKAGTIPQKWWPGLLSDSARLKRDLNPYDFVAHLHPAPAAPENPVAAG